jgi:PBP superfamily domain
MNTKLSLIGAAVAVAIAGQAQAFGPTVTPDVTVFIAGGSAQGPAFLAFAEKLLTAGFDVYTDSACGTQGANYRAVFGTGAASLPATLAGKKIFFEYANNGGTFKNGIDGLVRAHAVDYQTFLTNSTACPAGSATQFAVTNANTKENHIPVVGLSDEEIGLFVGVNLPAGNAAITTAELGNITTSGIYENVFGVAIDSVLAAQKTNFTKAEVAAIFSGSYSDWSQLTDAAGNPLPAGPITIIDRAAGSGSKAAFNEYFLANPGSFATGGALAPVNAAGGFGNCGAPATSGSGGYDANAYSDCPESSNGNVKAGLNNANTAGVRALGILGMEFQPAGTDHYQFAALNGVTVAGVTTKTCGNAVANPFEPALVVSGAYDFFFTNGMQYRIKSINGAPFKGDHTAQSDAITAFAAAATDPATEVSVPGVLLDPAVVGGPSGNAFDPCITKGTRNGNSTQEVQLQF